MPKLSSVQRSFLWDAANRYRNSLPGSEAERFLEKRGLTIEQVKAFGLGYVADPLPGHEMYRGMLAIPYMRWSPGSKWSVVSMRFRCIKDHEHENHGKYMSVPGDAPRVFNTLALLENEDTIAICEGELDAITASVNGVPAVGIAGVEAWKDHFPTLFLGYEAVYLLADGDDPGIRFANKVAKVLPNARILPSHPGEDVNSEVLKYGKDALLERVGK